MEYGEHGVIVLTIEMILHYSMGKYDWKNGFGLRMTSIKWAGMTQLSMEIV